MLLQIGTVALATERNTGSDVIINGRVVYTAATEAEALAFVFGEDTHAHTFGGHGGGMVIQSYNCGTTGSGQHGYTQIVTDTYIRNIRNYENNTITWIQTRRCPYCLATQMFNMGTYPAY